MAVVRFYEQGLARLLSGPTGPVYIDLGRRAVRVQSAARLIATNEPKVRTGRYRSSISFRLGRDARGPFAEIGSAVPYARILEEGSPPHEIRPRNKRALSWPEARHPVKRVRHPGTKPYRVLQRALKAAS